METEVFAVHADGQVWDRYRDGASWHDWEPLGGEFAGAPAAAARDADRSDLFAIGTDGLLHVGGRLDVFLRGADGALHYAALRP